MNSFYEDDIYDPNFDGYGLTENGEGLEDSFEDEVEIEDGEGNFSLPVQKNAEIEEVDVNLETDETVLSPSFAVDDVTQWEFPEEHGVLNAADEFVEGESVELDISAEGEESVEVKLPRSNVGSGNFYIEREEPDDPEYDVEILVRDESVWTRTDEDDLFGPLEDWASGMDMLSVDLIETEMGRYLVTGDLEGRLRVIDADTGESLNETTPSGNRLYKVVLLPGEEDQNLRGATLDRNGRVYSFTFDEQTGELTYTLVDGTHYKNNILLSNDITGNGWEDVITIRENEILGWLNDGSGELTDLTSMYELLERPEHVSITDEGGVVISLVDRDAEISNIRILESDDDGLIETENHTLETEIRICFGIEFTGDGNMEILVRTLDGHFEVWDEDDDGNMTVLQHLEIDHPINHMEVGDVTGNGLHDFVTVAHLRRDAQLYINDGEEFRHEESFRMNAGGYEANLMDVEGDGDTDILLVSRSMIHVARNRLNWKRERVSDLASSLQSYLDQSTPEYDQWNNPMVNVPITIRSEYDATFTLSDLNIQYDYSPTVDITEAVENHMDTAEANQTGWVNVPATITADDDVTFTAQTTVTYSARPPILSKHIPTYTARRAHEEHLIDLDDYFYDPLDQQLTYSITYQQDQDNLTAYVDEHYLSFHSEGKVGSYEFRVQATNELGYSIESNTFHVEVTPPPPELDLPDEYKLRAQERRWFDISPYASHYDHDNVSLTTDSEYITAHANNMTLELYYPQQMNQTVEVTLTANGQEASDLMEVTATPYAVPLFDPLPEPFLERGENLTRDNSFNLHNYTTHPEENVEDLDYSIVDWEHQDDINLSLEDGWITGSIHPAYDGTSNVTVSVEDAAENTDQTTFNLIVNDTKYAPEYLGGLEDATVSEGDTWAINLEEYFHNHHPDESVLYQVNKEYRDNSDITIRNNSWAVWEPGRDASDLTNVTFIASLWEYPALRTESEPINLTFNPRPVRYEEERPIRSSLVYPGETWSIDLNFHFSHSRGSEHLAFNVSHDEITIDNKTALWTPEEGSEDLTNVTFTAYDVENPHLNATSDTIDLIIPPPEPVIVSITPEAPEEGQEIQFSGDAENALGNVSYRWTSDIDGELSEQKEFSSNLTAGNHTISLEVMDSRGEWSEAYTTELIVEEKEEEDDEDEDEGTIQRFRSFFYSIEFQIALIIILIGVTLNFVGNYVLTEKS